MVTHIVRHKDNAHWQPLNGTKNWQGGLGAPPLQFLGPSQSAVKYGTLSAIIINDWRKHVGGHLKVRTVASDLGARPTR